MEGRKFFVGVDGGGTGTNGCLLNEEGEEVCTAVTASSNWNSVGKQKSREAVLDCISQLLEIGKVEKGESEFFCVLGHFSFEIVLFIIKIVQSTQFA